MLEIRQHPLWCDCCNLAMREEKRMEMKSLMRPNTIENQSTEEDFWRDLAFKNEAGKSDDGGGKEKKNKCGKRKKL